MLVELIFVGDIDEVVEDLLLAGIFSCPIRIWLERKGVEVTPDILLICISRCSLGGLIWRDTQQHPG